MAQHREVYRGGDRAKVGGNGKRSRNKKNQNKKRVIMQIKGSSSKGTVQVGQVVKKKLKKGKGGQG